MNLEITATNLIIGITVIISMIAMNNPKYFYNWAMIPRAIKRNNEYSRFMLSGFVHAGFMHLIFNMITLWSFGQFIENVFTQVFGQQYGMIVYVAFYLFAIVVSDIPTYLKHRNSGEEYISVGASGAVSAVIFAAILFIPTQTLYFFIIPMPAILFGVLYLGYSTFEAVRENPMARGINHSAHLWGAIFGIVAMIIAYPPSVMIFVEQIKNWSIF
jgi:membrane associated rhomboid family serine protease